MELEFNKKKKVSRAGWHRSLKGLSLLHREFQTSQGYSVGPCLKTKHKRKKKMIKFFQMLAGMDTCHLEINFWHRGGPFLIYCLNLSIHGSPFPVPSWFSSDTYLHRSTCQGSFVSLHRHFPKPRCMNLPNDFEKMLWKLALLSVAQTWILNHKRVIHIYLLIFLVQLCCCKN